MSPFPTRFSMQSVYWSSHISVVICSFFELGMISKWCTWEWVKALGKWGLPNQLTIYFMPIASACNHATGSLQFRAHFYDWKLRFFFFFRIFLSFYTFWVILKRKKEKFQNIFLKGGVLDPTSWEHVSVLLRNWKKKCHNLFLKSHICQNVWILAISSRSSGWVGGCL